MDDGYSHDIYINANIINGRIMLNCQLILLLILCANCI